MKLQVHALIKDIQIFNFFLNLNLYINIILIFNYLYLLNTINYHQKILCRIMIIQDKRFNNKIIFLNVLSHYRTEHKTHVIVNNF